MLKNKTILIRNIFTMHTFFQPDPDPDFIDNNTIVSSQDDPTPGSTLGISEQSGDLLNKYLKDEFGREVINVSYQWNF